jgi:hypothetical protein
MLTECEKPTELRYLQRLDSAHGRRGIWDKRSVQFVKLFTPRNKTCMKADTSKVVKLGCDGTRHWTCCGSVERMCASKAWYCG